MKKFILTLGSAAATLAPITAVVACEDVVPGDPDATPPVEDEEADPAVLKLHGFSSPDVEYPGSSGEAVNDVIQAIYIWTNQYAADNMGDGIGVTTISWNGETTDFTGGVANRVNISGEFEVKDYIGVNGEVFTDLSELMTYYENKWVEAEHVENQLTPNAEILFGIFELKIS